ncbi:helix-turn-helix transcriptional regulator [Nocardia anaemiae]|uniref:helix-turn-helix transcriptional regulator n=1 Tax=Nocardia anaemiae TaxID=263910 RepID=UPI000A003F23|nr:AAA family ATPase [Nocardia anaemiae]
MLVSRNIERDTSAIWGHIGRPLVRTPAAHPGGTTTGPPPPPAKTAAAHHFSGDEMTRTQRAYEAPEPIDVKSARPRLIGQLVGRTTEYERLSALVQDVGSGRGAIAIIEGEPGIGKTSLLAAATQLAAARGVNVLLGTACELEQHIPLSAIKSIRQSTVSVSSGFSEPALPVHQDPVTEQIKARQELAGIEYLLGSAEDYLRAAGPAVLIMDDAQWADHSSLLALRRLGEIVYKIPLLIVVAARPLPRDRGLTGLLAQFRLSGAEHLRLGALNDAEVAELVEIALGSPPGPDLSAIVSGAAGNPSYIIELVAGLMQANLIELGEIRAASRDSKELGTGALCLPRSLTDAIVRRLDVLPAQSRQILPMAAALGPEVEAIELSSILGATLIDVWQVLSAAVEAGILVRQGMDLVFRHGLIRQVLAGQLPPSTRSILRQRAAQILMSTEAPVERIAAHLLAGDSPLDSRSLDWMIEVADIMIARTPEHAVSLFEQASLTPGIDVERADVLRLQHIRALLRNGDAAEAETAARRALAEPSATADRAGPAHGTLLWLLAHSCFVQGQVPNALAVAESALTLSGLTAQQQGRFHGLCGQFFLLLDRFDAAEDAAGRAISIGDSCADYVASGLGYSTLGSLRLNQGFLGEAQELGERLLQGYQMGDDGRTEPWPFDPYQLRGRCLTELDQYQGAEDVLSQAVQHSAHTGGLHLASNLLEMASLHFLHGKWDDVLADLQACREAPDVFGHLAAVEHLGALVAVHRGRLTNAELPSVPDHCVGGGHRDRQLRTWVSALEHEAQGLPNLALQTLADACGEFTYEPCAATIGYMYPDVARLAIIIGRNDIAGKVATAAEAIEARYSTHSRRGTAALCRGLAEGSPELLFEAAQSFRRAGRPWHEGQAYENLAVVRAISGQLEEARVALDSAIDRYTSLNAEWDIARAEARLRECGIRRGRRGPRNRPKTGWAALTPTERKVADLVAQGRSNSDIATTMFLSPRTVQSHVSSILAKLNLQSRVQVAVALTRQNT